MENVLLNEYLKITGGIEIHDWFGYPRSTDNFSKSFDLRERCTQTYAWAIPNQPAIDTLVKYSPIVEIGAGTGYWAALVKQAGGDIIAFDPHPPRVNYEKNPYHQRTATFFPVKRGSYNQAKNRPDRTLFMCWPPYNSSIAYRTLREYTGSTLIFVGEGEGGCTGNDDFFKLLEYEFNIIEEVDIPQWYGIHDRMMVFERVNLSPASV